MAARALPKGAALPGEVRKLTPESLETPFSARATPGAHVWREALSQRIGHFAGPTLARR
jgi:hypothetical protein